MGLGAIESLLAVVELVRPALTAPGFGNFVVLFAGWVQTSGPHAVTSALVHTDVSRRVHHERFHRFFSRGTWVPDELGQLLFVALVKLLPPGVPIRAVLDDTLAAKKGPHIFGLGSHRDPVKSSKRFCILTFGHCWVVLAVLVPLPFSRRPWALPVLFRLYRNQKECLKKGELFRTKTTLAREMLDVLIGWCPGRALELAMDNAYCNDTVMRGLPRQVVVFGSMRPDAVLTAPPPPRPKKRAGRPALRGKVLPKPDQLAKDDRRPWKTCKAKLYGREQLIRYKELVGQWYRVAGTQLLRIVVVKVETGALPYRVFFCTELEVSVVRLLETYAGRWAIEVCFRELKQMLGFAESSARKREAVLRTAPFIGYIYSALVIWFARSSSARAACSLPIRPWYSHKKGFSFADILRTAQRVLTPVDVLDPRRGLADLQKFRRRRAHASARPLRAAA